MNEDGQSSRTVKRLMCILEKELDCRLIYETGLRNFPSFCMEILFSTS